MISRRDFLQKTGGFAAWAAAAPYLHALPSVQSMHAAQRRGKRVSVLTDGGFEGDTWGWQYTEGARIVSGGARSGRRCLEVTSRDGDYARFLVLTPRAGAKYTLSGWVRTEGVQPQEPSAGAYFTAAQFEFQGRPTQFTVDGSQMQETRYGSLTGTNGWRRFSQTFTCLPTTTWFEVAVGIYRAEGKAWFDDLTFVEGDAAADLDDTVTPEQAAQWAHEDLLAGIGSGKPRAAILRDELPVRGKASDPEELARLLDGDYETEFLSAVDLANAERFNRRSFDLLVLPYGESFPADAQPALESFLGSGGNFLSTGGYAFNSPLVQSNGKWEFADQVVMRSEGKQLVREGDFSGLLETVKSAGWRVSNAQFCAIDHAGDGKFPAAARVRVPADNWSRDASWTFDVPAEGDGRQFFFSAWVRCESIDASQGGYGFIGVEELDANGYPAYAAKLEFARFEGDEEWREVRQLFYLTPDTRRLRIRFGLHQATGTLWATQVRLDDRGQQIRINTALGFPEDSLNVKPTQIGVFDADYRLKRVAWIEAAQGQNVAPAAGRMTGDYAGYAASGVLGMNNARWIPLLQACDRLGRKRGAAGALMHLYNGPYSGSSWVFFGVDNADLFAPGNTLARQTLQAAGRALIRKCYLHECETDLACYRDGEPVRMRVQISNFGRERRQVTVGSTVQAVGGARRFEKQTTVTLAPGETRAVLVEWRPKAFDEAQYRIETELREGEAVLDRMETGFNVWRESVLRDGLPFEFRDNYFHVDGRSLFLQGTDDYLHTFVDRDENPLTWQADADGCRDSCIDVYENLMGLRGPGQNPTRAWWRWIDAMLLNVQRAGGVFFPGMLIFSNTAVSNRDLEDQKRYCRAFAERYRDAAGIMYYLNGDLELHDPNLPDLQALYRQFLRNKYGSDEALRKAWTVSPPKEPIDQLKVRSGTDDWRDLRTLDAFEFKVMLVRRWLDTLHDAIRTVDQKHPVTAEFYQMAAGGIDLVSALGKLELANFGYFAKRDEDFDRFPQTLKFLDLSLRGRGINVGEFGVKTHPAWNATGYYIEARSEAYEQDYFLDVGHYAFGLGASKIQNWCWKYPADLPFEWGINYPCDMTPRDVRFYYRNNGLMFRRFRPKYEIPEVLVLIPGAHRKGGQGAQVREGVLNGIRLLLDARVRIATLDDEFMESFPDAAKAVFYPLAYCPDDHVIERLKQYVQRGGVLYLSGDVSYDPLRQRTRTARLRELCGVEFAGENYPNIDYRKGSRQQVRAANGSGWPEWSGAPGIRIRPVGARVLSVTEEGAPVVTEYQLGKGRVIFSSDPVELHAPALTSPDGHQVYTALLRQMDVQAEQVEPSGARLHLLRTATETGDSVRVLVNYDPGQEIRDVRLPSASGAISLTLPARRPGVAVTDAAGRVIAAESAADVRQGQKLLFGTNLHAMAIAADRQPLDQTRTLLLLPMGTGELRIPHHGRWRDPVVLVGEVEGGIWKTRERLSLDAGRDELVIPVDADRNLTMLVLGERGDEAALARLMEHWVRRPWLLDDADSARQ